MADTVTLTEACPAVRHGMRMGMALDIDPLTFDPECHTCLARKTLAEHDHLHLHGEVCTTLGVGGYEGEMVRCKCGGFHH